MRGRFGPFDLLQTRRGRPDGDLAVARYVPLLPASWPNGLAQCAHWLPIELPGNSGGLLVRCRSMAPRAYQRVIGPRPNGGSVAWGPAPGESIKGAFGRCFVSFCLFVPWRKGSLVNQRLPALHCRASSCFRRSTQPMNGVSLLMIHRTITYVLEKCRLRDKKIGRFSRIRSNIPIVGVKRSPTRTKLKVGLNPRRAFPEIHALIPGR